MTETCAAFMMFQFLTVAIIVLASIQRSDQQCHLMSYRHISCKNMNQSNIEDYTWTAPSYGGQQNIQQLNIEDSCIQVLSANLFRNWQYITYMYLEEICIYRITPDAFKVIRSSLKELHLKDNHLKKLTNDVFNLPSLTFLDLKQNELEEIEDNSFQFLNSLHTIFLCYNNLQKILSNLFDSMKNLEYLDISHNSITSLSNSVFWNNLHLQIVYLNNNNLSSIPHDIFINNKNITFLNLSHNPIKHIDYNMFVGLYWLKTLNVAFTERETEFNLSRIDILKIAELSLDDKNIKEIDDALYINATSLSLSRNNLNYINSTMFQKCIYLLNLNLSGNKIENIDGSSFSDLTSLKSLDLSDNRIQFLPHGLFANVYSLEHLNISCNLIKNLPYGIFDVLQKLKSLDLSSNEISSISPYSLHALRNLTEFYLDNNNIEYLDGMELATQLYSLKSISFDSNLWICPRLIKLVHILENRGIKVIHGNTIYIHNVNKIKCDDIISQDYNDGNNTVNLSDIKENIKKLMSAYNSKFYSSSMYTFFNKGFKDTEFYNFFKNIKYKVQITSTVNGSDSTNSSSTLDRAVAYKLVTNEKPTTTNFTSLEVVLYLICISLIGNLCFTMYKYFNAKNRRKAVSNRVFESNTELV